MKRVVDICIKFGADRFLMGGHSDWVLLRRVFHIRSTVVALHHVDIPSARDRMGGMGRNGKEWSRDGYPRCLYYLDLISRVNSLQGLTSATALL